MRPSALDIPRCAPSGVENNVEMSSVGSVAVSGRKGLKDHDGTETDNKARESS